jgi:hypothetical protein
MMFHVAWDAPASVASDMVGSKMADQRNIYNKSTFVDVH